MNDAALFEATVPPFLHYLRRIDVLLSDLPDSSTGLLERRLAPRAFTAAEHFETASGFPLRTVLPLLGRDLPPPKENARDRESLLRLAREVLSTLEGVTPADFDGAARRTIRHTAGAAELEQDAVTFATVFALPNFFFHLSTAFSILRHGGENLGKADFDGLHAYAAGFHF